MAVYNTKYNVPFRSKRGVYGSVSIKKKNYVGDTIDLKMTPGGLSIDYKFKDWSNPIIGQSCSLNILNDKPDWYELEDLMSAEEKTFQILVDATDASGNNIELFNGWINSETVSQKYLHNSMFKLTGSNFISKLKNLDTSVGSEAPGPTSFMNMLGGCFQDTGIYKSTRINCSLNPYTNPLPNNKTCFSESGSDSESFWKNDVEKIDSLKSIEMILKPFDCYTYPWDGKWYVERYGDLDLITGGNKNYVQYITGVLDYSPGSTGTLQTLNEPSANLADLDFIGGSQTMQMIPGFNRIDVKLNEEYYLNIAPADFNSYPWYELNTANYATFSYRAWWHSKGPITDASVVTTRLDEPYKEIRNAYNYNVYGWAWYNDDGWGENDFLKSLGVSTGVFLTVADASTLVPTEMNIKWKWNNGSTPGSSNYYGNLYGYVKWYRLWYYVKEVASGNFLKYNSDSQEWELVDEGEGYPWRGAQYIEIPPDSVNQRTGTYEASVTIPISEIEGITTGDSKFVICIAHSQYRFESPVTQATSWHRWCKYGDIQVTVSGAEENNVFVARLDNDTLEREKIEIDFFDTLSANYRNRIRFANNYSLRSYNWTNSAGSARYPLAQWLIADKFQLYNKNRRTITGNILHPGFLKPLSLWVDGNDPSTRQYVLTNYSYKPDSDTYKATWWEYDNSETINFT